MWDNVNFHALPTSNVPKDKRAKTGFAKMAALITRIVLDSMSAFKNDVSTLAQWAKPVVPTRDARPKIRPSIAAVLQDLLAYPQPSKAV